MKRITVYVIILFAIPLIGTACQTENKYPTDNIVPEKFIIQNFPTDKTVQFAGFNFPEIIGDSIETDRTHLKMSSDSASILIMRYDENNFIKRLLGDNPEMRSLLKKHQLHSGYEMLKLVYYVTPETQIEDRNKLLELKSILIPTGSENSLIEYKMPSGHCFQSGNDENERIILNWFVGNNEFLIITNNVPVNKLRQFLGGVSSSFED